jgi:hypothetical protein
MVLLPAAGQRDVEELATFGTVHHGVAGVDGHALGGVDGGGVAELDVLGNVVRGESHRPAG